MYWYKNDLQAFEKINQFVKKCKRGNGLGTGKAERLGNNLSGWSAKRITKEHRFVYRLDADTVYILMCRDHY